MAELDNMSFEQLMQSIRDAGRIFSSGASAYRGVNWWKNGGKWRASFRVPSSGKLIQIDVGEEELAAAIYDGLARRVLGRCVAGHW